MISAVVAAALWALAAGLVLSIVLGLLVAGLIALSRPAAATRGALWSLALAFAGFAPVAILAGMLARGALAGASAPAPMPAAAAHVAPAAKHTAAHPGRQTWTPLPTALAHPEQLLRIPGLPDITPLAGEGVIAIWLLGALIGLVGLGRSLARVRGLKGRSSPLDGTLATELPWLTTTPGREIYLRLSYETETPIAVGFRRPVILLPTEMATADGLTSIEPLIMHEYAHLARYDDWSNLVQRATERIFWFNPLVWFLGRRIALEREVAADEAVVARTHDPKVYATTLWRMAQEMRMPEHVVVAPGAMLTRKQISVRIERLLDETPAGRRHAGAAAFGLALIALTGVAALAASAPAVVLAQNETAMAMVNEPGDIASPAAKVAPIELPRVVKSVVENVAQQAVVKSLARPKIIVVPPSDAMEGLGERISSEIQRNLGSVSAGRQVASGSVSRDMIASCIGCDFSHRDLRGLDLSNLSLVGDTFDRADLRGANFSNSKLEGLSFQRADLRKANFHAAKLTGIDFTRSTLDEADLSDASLMGVDLTHASMAGANTTGIRLIGSSLP